MIMKGILLVLLVLSALFSCQNDCKDVLCFTPPRTYNFELIGKSSGNDLLAAGPYSYNQISVIDRETNKSVTFNRTGNDSINLIQFDMIGWKTEVVDYQVTIADSIHFGLYVDATRTNENCCSFTRYNDIKIEDTEYKLDSLTGIYKIFIRE